MIDLKRAIASQILSCTGDDTPNNLILVSWDHICYLTTGDRIRSGDKFKISDRIRSDDRFKAGDRI